LKTSFEYRLYTSSKSTNFTCLC